MIRASKELLAKVRSISAELDMPMSQVINMLVNQWIKENR